MSIEDYVVRHARETDIFAKPPARHSCVVCYASVLHDRQFIFGPTVFTYQSQSKNSDLYIEII